MLPKFGGFSFVSWANSLSLLPITWPGHSGDVRIKPSHGFAITSVEVLSPVIYNYRTRHKHDQILQATKDRKTCDQHKSANQRQAEFRNRQLFACQRDSHPVGAAVHEQYGNDERRLPGQQHGPTNMQGACRGSLERAPQRRSTSNQPLGETFVSI